MTRTAGMGALLFDIDGTLTDTDPIHIRAFNIMLADFGMSVTLEEYLSQVMGFTNAEILRNFFPDKPVSEHRRLAEFKESTFRRLAATELVPTPGLIAFMDFADAKGIPMAAVTNAPATNADMMLTSLGVKHRFRTVVIGDELPRGKPDPMPYLVAGERLGVDCADCIAFEDSRSGMRSASGSGAFAIGLVSSLPEAELVKAGAKFAVKDFTDARLGPLVLERLRGAAAMA
jgi:HAD superfamily hydrolase (TIGR01509 family)